MSILSQLSRTQGSSLSRKRIGRGDSSGWGGTAGKGHKGQKARSGGKVRRGFEGGQTPLIRRLPKFGFTNAQFKKVYEIVTTGQLNDFSEEVTVQSLQDAGLVRKGDVKVKILSQGELKSGLHVKVHKWSQSAQAAIKKAGGTIEGIECQQ